MKNPNLTFAHLNGSQIQALTQAEQSFGADYLIALEPGGKDSSRPVAPPPQALRVAPLTASQLECLNGLEDQLHAIVVAYRKSTN